MCSIDNYIMLAEYCLDSLSNDYYNALYDWYTGRGSKGSYKTIERQINEHWIWNIIALTEKNNPETVIKTINNKVHEDLTAQKITAKAIEMIDNSLDGDGDSDKKLQSIFLWLDNEVKKYDFEQTKRFRDKIYNAVRDHLAYVKKG